MIRTIAFKQTNFLLLVALAAMLFLLSILILTYPLYSLIFLALTFFVTVAAVRPEYGLYLVALFLPVIFWQPFYSALKIETSFLDILAFLALIGFGLRIAYLNIAGEKIKIVLPFIKPFLFFFGAVLLSGILADTSSALYTVRWILFPYAAFVVYPANVISDKKILRNVIIFFLLSVAYAAAMGLFSVLEQSQSLADDIFQGKFFRFRLIKIFGIYPLGDFQNLLAEIMLPGVFFALALKHWIKSERGRKFLNILAVVFCIIAIGTFSRAAWISLAAAGVAYVIFQNRKELKRYFVYSLLILALSLPAWFYMYKIQTYHYIGGLSNQQKILMLDIALNAFGQNPVLGQGSGQFINMIERNFTYMSRYGDPLDSHGVIQKIMAENGMLGLILFFTYIVAVFSQIFKSAKMESKNPKFMLPLASACLAVFLMELFNTSYYQGKLWLPIGIALAAAKLLQTEENPRFVKNSYANR